MEKIVVVHSQLDEVPKVLSVEYHRRAIEQGDFTLSEEILEEKKDTIIIYDYEDYTLVVAVTIAVKLSLKVRLRTMYIFVNAESVA
jgi:hypothetical protein